MGALLSTCSSVASSVRSFLCESYGWLTSCFPRNMKEKSVSTGRELSLQEKEKLGDVWDDTTVHEAYQKGEIRSIPNAGNSSDEPLRISFSNDSPTQELIMCWISPEGELHHYYRLVPNGGDHLETTRCGDAFAMFQVPATTTTTDEEEGLAPLCNADTIVAAYRPTTNETSDHHLVSIRHDDKASNGNLRGSHKKQKVGWTIVVSQKEKTPSIKPPAPKMAPIDTSEKFYERRKYGIWTAYCEPGCWDPPSEDSKEEDNYYPLSAHQAFQADLQEVTKRIPEHVRHVLSESTVIYMNKSHPYAETIDNPVGCFHPGKDWLVLNKMNPDKCGQVEFYNVHNYNKHRRLWGTGGIILHELCHAYHKKHLPDGYSNQDITDCYQAAMKEGLYESVQYHCGVAGCKEDTKEFEHITRSAKHYACSNSMEFFAELSVAFLSSLASRQEEEEEGETKEETDNNTQKQEEEEYNKWFPHNTAQLKEHDPRAYELLQKLWGVSLE